VGKGRGNSMKNWVQGRQKKVFLFLAAPTTPQQAGDKHTLLPLFVSIRITPLYNFLFTLSHSTCFTAMQIMHSTSLCLLQHKRKNLKLEKKSLKVVFFFRKKKNVRG